MSVIGKTKLRILRELSKHPVHGYYLSKKLNITISSIYAHLSELEDEGFVFSEVRERHKVYHLTEKGRKLLQLFFE